MICGLTSMICGLTWIPASTIFAPTWIPVLTRCGAPGRPSCAVSRKCSMRASNTSKSVDVGLSRLGDNLRIVAKTRKPADFGVAAEPGPLAFGVLTCFDDRRFDGLLQRDRSA